MAAEGGGRYTQAGAIPVVQIQEASRSDLMVRMVAAAARDHGPAVFAIGESAEDLVIASVIVRRRMPIELVAVGDEQEALRGRVARACGFDPARVRAAPTLEAALFGKNAWITGARGAAGKTVPAYEYEARYGLLRFNPLAAWSEAEVSAWLAAERVTAVEAFHCGELRAAA
jgi:hypothetical protein